MKTAPARHAEECPSCHGLLEAEQDDRYPSGLSWHCPAPDCTEDGCWPVPVTPVEGKL